MNGRGRGIPAVALLAWALLAIPATMAHDDDDDDDSDEEHEPHFHSVEEMGGQAERGEVPEIWLSQGQITRPYLLEVQAIIVKDEQVTDDCKPSDADLRKSNWRHFMCYGSILSNTFVLTTTSCLHEALYIRHNIRASLAVVIAPVSESIQVIKISQYIIHPKLDVDPRHTQDHIRHDVAIAKLSCKISKKNFFPIVLPTKPLNEVCKGDQCYVTVIKRKEDHSNLIFEYMARDIERHKVSARKINARDKRNENDNIKAATETRLMCTKTGSAVMANKIQAGVVAMSCDVRQPETPWLYTDLFDNVDWIVGVADLEKPKEYIDDNTEVQNEKPPEKCSTCVYNFYFDWKQKDMCPNKIINDVGASLTTCKGNSADPGPKQQNSSTFIAAYPRDDYLRALDVMYRDQFKHNHQGVPIAPPSENKKSINEHMIPVTNNFGFSKKNDTNNNDLNQNVEPSKTKEDENVLSDDELLINQQMIPVSDNFEVNKNTDANNNQKSAKSIDSTLTDANNNQESAKSIDSTRTGANNNKESAKSIDSTLTGANNNKESAKSIDSTLTNANNNKESAKSIDSTLTNANNNQESAKSIDSTLTGANNNKESAKSIDSTLTNANNNQEPAKSIDSTLTGANNNQEPAKSIDSTLTDANNNQESAKSSKIADEVETKREGDIPEEYKTLYKQYLQELQLKNS